MSHQRIIRISTVKAVTGLSRGSIYRLIKESDFPKQIKLSAQAAGWIESEINDWLESRIAKSREQGKALS